MQDTDKFPLFPDYAAAHRNSPDPCQSQQKTGLPHSRQPGYLILEKTRSFPSPSHGGFGPIWFAKYAPICYKRQENLFILAPFTIFKEKPSLPVVEAPLPDISPRPKP